MQRLPLHAERRRAAVETVADQRQAARREVNADLVRAAAVQRAAQRGEARRAAATRSTSVRAGLPDADDRHPRAQLRIAADRRLDAPARLRAARRARSRGSGAAPRAPRSRASARSPRRASGRRPSAPTCPCRAGGRCRRAAAPRSPGRARASALSSVPDQLPAAGWTTMPAALSITSTSSSSWTTASGSALGADRRGSPRSAAASTSTRWPARTRCAGLATTRAVDLDPAAPGSAAAGGCARTPGPGRRPPCRAARRAAPRRPSIRGARRPRRRPRRHRVASAAMAASSEGTHRPYKIRDPARSVTPAVDRGPLPLA